MPLSRPVPFAADADASAAAGGSAAHRHAADAAPVPTVDPARAFAALAARVDVVLVRPSHAGNIGAAARALRVMGLSRLSVVAPRAPDFAAAPEAVAFASGATDVLGAAGVHADVPAALATATLSIAVSAAGREFAAPPIEPETAARLAFEELRADASHRVAFLFGNERTGLSIADAQRCQLLCSIPTDAGYGSLNLAQAVQVVAYCVRREWLALLESSAASGAERAGTASEGAAAAQRRGAGDDPASPRGFASAGRVEAMLDHLERALVAIGFLDPASPKRLMPRLRRLFARTRLNVEEVDILRGVAGAMIARSADAANARPARHEGAAPRAARGEPTTPTDADSASS